WSGRPADEVPIGHVTNGVHVHSWLAPQMWQLYSRHMGIDWADHSAEPEGWGAIDGIDDGELWDLHQVLKARLLAFVRRPAVPAPVVGRRVGQARGGRNEPAERIGEGQTLLDPDVLTIGFARRFATYKRATLLLSDLERLRPLMTGDTPIQLIFAGKAHPQDN